MKEATNGIALSKELQKQIVVFPHTNMAYPKSILEFLFTVISKI